MHVAWQRRRLRLQPTTGATGGAKDMCTTITLASAAGALLGDQAGSGSQAMQASQAQAESAHKAGQAARQPAEPGEQEPGGASPAKETTISRQFNFHN